MTNADADAFATMMLGLGEAYGEAVSDARIDIYFTALSDFPLDVIRAAANIHVRTQKFFPRPSELREALTGSSDDRADLAWTAVLALVRRYGYIGTDGKGKPPEFPDDATRRAALELYGGWRALCEKLPGEGPELLGAAKLFKATFRALDGLQQRELSAGEASATLSQLVSDLAARGLPTHGF